MLCISIYVNIYIYIYFDECLQIPYDFMCDHCKPPCHPSPPPYLPSPPSLLPFPLRPDFFATPRSQMFM